MPVTVRAGDPDEPSLDLDVSAANSDHISSMCSFIAEVRMDLRSVALLLIGNIEIIDGLYAYKCE